MLVSLDWLNELVDISDLSTEEIINTLSLHSTEVEGVERVISGTNLVVGHVLTCDEHPNSDHLHVTTVDVGDETLQIVCGAPNVKKGQFVIVAKVGAVLPGDFKIKPSTIRGVESNGMICSLQELGMESKFVPSEYSEGIYYFKKPVKAGSDPLELLHFKREVLDLAITPNRSDLMSMLGVAYEVSAAFNRPLKPVVSILLSEGELTKDLISVELKSKDCLTYHARVVKDVKISKSPDWLISRLIAFGIRPINNAVDITNYILALYGQPLHAFDYDLLGKSIVVRNANENEEMVTLDNINRKLLPTDLVITDGTKPVALAGVMGGLGTSINDNTKNIVLEAAVFDPITIRKTYTRLDLRSESSIRFEKGIDLNRTKEALDYACYLYEQLCGATVSYGDYYRGKLKTDLDHVKTSVKDVNSYLGIKINASVMASILDRLDFKYTLDKNEFDIEIPSRRLDIKIKADIIEEIGRIYGYDSLPVTLPKTNSAGMLTPYQRRRRELKHILSNMGLIEVINYSLKENNNEFRYLMNEDEEDITLLLPISQERKTMRRELLSSLISNFEYNFNRKNKNCAFFEVGKVYSKNVEWYTESEHLSIGLSGLFSSTLWRGEKEVSDFFLLKGILEELFSHFDITFTFEKLDKEVPELHPLRSATIKYNGEVVGVIGEVHPKYLLDKGLEKIVLLELTLDKLLHQKDEIKVYKKISKVPSVERDLAFVCKKEILSSTLVEAIKSVDKTIISDVIIFDVYSDDKLSLDEKSIALKIIFTSDETLKDDVINKIIEKIIKKISYMYGAKLRS